MSEIVVWRICAGFRESSAFTGEGAARRGGRWNRTGVRMVYCAESRALAALEILVHADDTGSLGAVKWICIPATLPASLVEAPPRFPARWRDYPYSTDTQDFGAAWVRERRSAVMRVPSAVVAGEFNYLLNPAHADFERIKMGKAEPFTFDPRLSP